MLKVYDPNHFLDVDGVVIKPPAFQPFGVGRRVCLGETLAKNDMFLIIVNLLQKLRFKAIPGRKYNIEPTLAGRFNAVEEPYEVLIEKRA